MHQGVATALTMLLGHYDFLERNTGITNSADTDAYVLNPDGVLANNRHFIAHTHQEYQPNGDATTEGQSLLITAAVYAYKATGDARLKAFAEKTFDAYVRYFYGRRTHTGDTTNIIPATPERWIQNWLVNGKEPVIAHYPRNTGDDPTHGGFKCVPLMFVDGLAQVPHGAPFYGEWLDMASFAHRGLMGWGSVAATVKHPTQHIDFTLALANRITTTPSDTSVLQDQFQTVDWDAIGGAPTIDWSNDTPAPTYPIKYIITWSGEKIEYGSQVETGIPSARFGEVMLDDDTINGVYFLNFAVRLPVQLGGYELQRNEVWHNRPIHTPLVGPDELRGNAADGEVWFADACHAMWEHIDNKAYGSKYYRAWKACEYTALEYMEIDRSDKFYRKSKYASTIFTDGISYDFTYYPTPGGDRTITYGRDANGYITIQAGRDCKHSLEQQAITFNVSNAQSIRTTWGGLDVGNQPLTAEVQIGVSTDKSGQNETIYSASLAASTQSAVAYVDTPMTDFIRTTDDSGNDYLIAKLGAVTDYGGCVPTAAYETNVYDGRSTEVVTALFPDDNAGFIIGAWLTTSGLLTPETIVYRATHDFNLRIEDANGWRWYWLLPATSGNWVNLTLKPTTSADTTVYQLPYQDIVLSGWQPNHIDATVFPTAPVFGPGFDQIQIILDAANTNAEFQYYCLNTVPPRFDSADTFVTKYRLTIAGSAAFNANVGDCTAINVLSGLLYCVPGVVPFSNIYVIGAETFGAWHGLPYPGYQYPWLFTNAAFNTTDPETMLNNSIEFLYQSQQWYGETFGEFGPGASAYIWNRSDNTAYGPADTWTMYHWGNGHAWSGYQPRAFFAGARAWAQLEKDGAIAPQKLKDYVNNWLTWLIQFAKKAPPIDVTDTPEKAAKRAAYRCTPTEFSATSTTLPVYDDFNGHMTGLWLAGASFAKMAGSDIPELDWFMDFCVQELQTNYVIRGIPGQPMDSSWSSWAGGGYFYGFWAGEILRGLSLYALASTGKRI